MGPKARLVGGGLLGFCCPGCGVEHMVRVEGEPPGRWSFDGNLNAPTLAPSVMVRATEPLSDEAYDAWRAGAPLPEPRPTTCHSFVRAGRIQFLADCSHPLAGQTVDLPEWA